MPTPTTGRPCSICRHPDRVEIDRALIAGRGFAEVSRAFAGLTEDAVGRHHAKHLPRAVVQDAAGAREEAEGERGADLLAEAQSLRRRAMALLGKAETVGELRTALAGVREAGRLLELEAKLRGQIEAAPTVSVVLSPAWLQVQTVILAAIEPYPAARDALVRALEGIG